MDIAQQAERIANEMAIKTEIDRLQKEIDICNKIIKQEMNIKLKLMLKIEALK